MGKKYDFDYIIIGSGPAGSSAALNLAKTKKRIALVEGRFFGGSNLNTRNIPYKVSLDFSETYKKAYSLPEFKNQNFTFSLPTLLARQLKTISACNGNNQKIFEDAGIKCYKGFANFLDSNTIAIDEKKLTANSFILATGSRLKTTEISGINSVKYLTPETAIRIRRLPKVAVIVGGGSTGCEIAEYYASLGIKVIILETSDRLLPREDLEVGEVITDYFTRRLNIMVLPSSKVVALEEDKFSKRVIFHTNGSEKMIRTDCVVLATGSQPVTDYGLENADIKYKNSGIVVDKLFETSKKNIYAIGDALGKNSSTEIADYEGLILSSNLMNKTKNPANYRGFVRLTEIYPEVATVGFNEDDLLRRDRKYKKAIIKLGSLTASRIYDFNYGFIKLLADKTNHLIGATIVAPNAESIILELSLALRHNLTILELASTPHPINSFSYGIKLAAKELLLKK